MTIQKPLHELKVIIAHDWINGMRGGERVLSAILEIFPQAKIYTLLYIPNKSNKLIDSFPIKAHWANKFPLFRKYYRHFLPIFPLFMETFYVEEECDLLISSTHCLIKGIKTKNRPLHLSYYHSPMRYIYDQFDSYFVSIPQKIVGWIFRNFLQTYDRITNNSIDLFIANSEFVKKRIEKYYEQKSCVLHPFVDLEDFPKTPLYPKATGIDEYFIVVCALAPNKRVDLAIDAFSSPLLSHKKLKIIGDGQLEKKLKSNLAKNNITNIEFLGSLPRVELIKSLSQASALIFPGVEDFGITPLESLACFTPVIAFHAGGVLETLNEKVAEFFYEPSVDSLVQAILKFDPNKFKPKDLQERANQFSKQIFQSKLISLIQNTKR